MFHAVILLDEEFVTFVALQVSEMLWMNSHRFSFEVTIVDCIV